MLNSSFKSHLLIPKNKSRFLVIGGVSLILCLSSAITRATSPNKSGVVSSTTEKSDSNLKTSASLKPVELSYARKKATIHTAKYHASRIMYDSVEKLEEDSDLILIGRPTLDFLDRRHVNEFASNGMLISWITEGPFEVSRVIKGKVALNADMKAIVLVAEGTGLFEQPRRGLTKMQDENNYELKEGSLYMVFLKRNPLGSYSIINGNLGQFNLDGTDPEDDNEAVALAEKAMLAAKEGKEISEAEKSAILQPTQKQKFREAIYARYQQYLR
jgi:hypothetical protein